MRLDPWMRRCGLSIAIAIVACAAAAQELSFRAPYRLETTGNPADILIADYNGDLRPDVFVTIFNRATVAILTNMGAAGLSPAVYTQAPTGPNRMTAGDFDSDGRLDLVVTETESDFVYFKRGLEDGTFEFPERVDADHDPLGIGAADMNGDGHLDLVVATASEATGQVNVMLGRGDGTFDYDMDRSRRVGLQAYDVAIADLDGDGFLDVVVPIQNGNLGILMGDGTGALNRVQLVPAGQQLFQVRLADLDGDGALDVVAADPGAFGLQVLLGDGAGGFEAPTYVAVGSNLWTLRLVDVDADGFLDALVASPATGDVGVLLGRGDGTFAPPRYYLAPLRPFAADAIDLNDDGYVDLVAASQAEVGGAVNVLRGSAEGFAAVEAILRQAQVGAIAARDLDLDGRPELVVASAASSSIAVVDRNVAGGFHAPRDVVSGVDVKALQVGDVDGDGILDIVAATDGDPSLTIAIGLADGTFAAARTVALPWPVASLALADLDGDGIGDVAARADLGTTSIAVVLYGSSDGLFSTPVELPVEGFAFGVDMADLNGDGRLDLMVGNTTRSEITIFTAIGTREWAAPVAIATAFPPVAVAWGDLDGDAAIDLVYGGPNAVRTLFADGEGGFSNGAALAVSGVITAIAVRDLTGDLRPDIAAISQTANGMFAYENSGSRFDFSGPLTVPLGMGPKALLTADLDADGRYDAVVVGGGVWSILNDGALPALRGDGNGDGRFSAADLTALARVFREGSRRPVEAAGPSGFPGVDANGDGWIDGDDRRILTRRIFGAGLEGLSMVSPSIRSAEIAATSH